MNAYNVSVGSQSLADSLRLMGRVLTFRAQREELLALNRRDLVIGLLITWLVGMGRYWDNDRVEFLQKLGVGSVLYVFVLATFLFCVLWPLRPRDWSWFSLLVFLTFTSPPGLVYAIPVQLIFPGEGLQTANEINLGFLGLVSVWRVALFLFYLCRLGRLDLGTAAIGTALPILLLIVVLTVLNLDRVVFRIMGGIDPAPVSPNDDIYLAMIMITMSSMVLIWPVLILYGVAIMKRNPKRFQKSASDVGSGTDSTISESGIQMDGHERT